MWEVLSPAGTGTFSDIFECVHLVERTRCALKVDKAKPPSPNDQRGQQSQPAVDTTLQWESDLLLRLQKYPLVPRHYGLL